MRLVLDPGGEPGEWIAEPGIAPGGEPYEGSLGTSPSASGPVGVYRVGQGRGCLPLKLPTGKGNDIQRLGRSQNKDRPDRDQVEAVQCSGGEVSGHS